MTQLPATEMVSLGHWAVHRLARPTGEETVSSPAKKGHVFVIGSMHVFVGHGA